MRHRIKHHVNRPVLHLGLFTDGQMLPAAGLFTLAAGWAYAGGGSAITRALIAGLMLLPVGIMVVDNRVGGIVITQAKALVLWRREAGILTPGEQEAHGWELAIDVEDQLVLDREEMAQVDLEAVFASDSGG